MDFFKIHKAAQDLPLDERDWPLDPRDIPLIMALPINFDLDNKFGITDKDYDAIDNVSGPIEKQAKDDLESNPSMSTDDVLDHENDEPHEDDLSYLLDEPLEGNEAGEEEFTGEEQEAGEEEPEAQQDDPNFQGMIRTVKGANLVYKRQMPDNTYTELWIMNVGKDMKKESQIKRAVLAGTDIDISSGETPDGKQKMELYTIGNVQFCEISGLEN